MKGRINFPAPARFTVSQGRGSLLLFLRRNVLLTFFDVKEQYDDYFQTVCRAKGKITNGNLILRLDEILLRAYGDGQDRPLLGYISNGNDALVSIDIATDDLSVLILQCCDQRLVLRDFVPIFIEIDCFN